MSLEQWSLLYFVACSVYYFSIFISLFTTLTFGKILVALLAFSLQCGVTLFYGISTDQIGLVLLAGVQVLMVILIFTQYGRLFNENKNS